MFLMMLIGGLVWIVLFAWIFLAVTAAGALVSMLALRESPELLKERWKGAHSEEPGRWI